MLSHLVLSTLLAGGGLATAAPQDAQQIFAEMERRRAERVAEVSDYLMVTSVGGIKTVTWHEKTASGVFRMVPVDEIQDRTATLEGREPVRATEEWARAYEMLGDALRQGMAEEGFPADGPFEPRNMADPMAAFMRPSTSAEPLPDGRAEAAAQAGGMPEFARRARFVGREAVDGRDAFHLRATDLQDVPVSQSDGGEFRLESASLYIDPVEYVTLKVVIEGSGRSGGGEWAPITIETLNQEYRRVGTLYEPHVQVMRLGGIEEAMAEEMREMQAQLDELPPSVRQMIENQMKNAMNQFEAVVVVESILPNTGLPTAEMMAEAYTGG